MSDFIILLIKTKTFTKIYEFLLYNKLKSKVKTVDINLQILKITHFL